MKKLISVFLLLISCQVAKSQELFPNRCVGKWKGMMHIYAAGKLKDSVSVKLTVAVKDSRSWTWKTEYLSDKYPMTKDYVLKLVNPSAGHYITDEGEGIEINDYVYGDKMYSAFETAGFLLTSTYELHGDKLTFEVLSGKKSGESGEVISHPVTNLQRVVFSKN